MLTPYFTPKERALLSPAQNRWVLDRSACSGEENVPGTAEMKTSVIELLSHSLTSQILFETLKQQRRRARVFKIIYKIRINSISC
jgi:hypothetical protein